jgi:hypothetical protein
MSSPWVGLSQQIQKFLWDQQYRQPRYESIDCVMQARSKNITITEQDMGSLNNGKNRTFKVMSYPIDCNSVASDCSQTFCNPGDVMQPEVQLFNVSRCTASKPFTIHNSDLRLVDDGGGSFSQHALAQMAAKMGAIRKELASEITTLILANAGTQLDGNPTSRITMTNNATGVIQPIGMWDIEKVFADGGFTDPHMLGSTEVFQWKKALGIATANNTTGQDYSQLGEKGLFYDVNLNNIAGDLTNGEHVLAFDPQALKFVTYSKNVGIFATDLQSLSQIDVLFQKGGTDYLKGAFYDPQTGLIWDLYVNYDKCLYDNEGGFTIFIQLQWDIFFPKVQHCNVNSVNGIFHFRTCPIKLTPCPTGDNPSPAVNPTVYTNTPGAIFPISVLSVSCNGVSTTPHANVTSIDDLVALLNLSNMGGVTFAKSGSNIVYTGYKALTVTIVYNGGSHTLVFA